MLKTIVTLGVLAGAGLVSAVTVARRDAEHTLRATLTADAVRPGPGAAGASGEAMVRLVVGEGQLCYDVTVSGIGDATAAHIHLGGPSRSGPPVFPLRSPTGGSVSGCADANRALVRDMVEAPDEYYVDVHTASHERGALRGQLGR